MEWFGKEIRKLLYWNRLLLPVKPCRLFLVIWQRKRENGNTKNKEKELRESFAVAVQNIVDR